jgi:hypothetical protein
MMPAPHKGDDRQPQAEVSEMIAIDARLQALKQLAQGGGTQVMQNVARSSEYHKRVGEGSAPSHAGFPLPPQLLNLVDDFPPKNQSTWFIRKSLQGDKNFLASLHHML